MRVLHAILIVALTAVPSGAQVTFTPAPAPLPRAPIPYQTAPFAWNPTADYIEPGQDEPGYRAWLLRQPWRAGFVQAFHRYLAAAEVAGVLDALWGDDDTLIVISTDLSHFLSYGDAQALDAATARQILGLDETLEPEQACGAYAVRGFLQAARRRRLAPRMLDLRNSGDTAGDRRRVVGYAAFAFSREAA